MGDAVHHEGSGVRGLPYVPGLDGVRGLAVLAVIAYHLEWPVVPGGFFGVSLFFTMSGYLITQLIVREFEADGHVRLTAFWARRLRRLMPASLVVIAAVAALSSTTTIFDGPRLRGDLFAGLGYVANWRLAETGNSYEDLFTATASPLQHFWSLAIEEQLYLIFPLVLIGLLVVRRRSVVVVGIALLASASVGAGFLTESRLYSYYGTHVRAVEVLVGALLALAVPVGREVSRGVARGIALVAAAAAAVMGFLVATVHTSDDFVYEGGLAVFSLLSGAVILGVLVPGPIRWVTSWRPLRAVGVMSYGAYLYHWPIFVALDADRVGFGGWRLDVIRVALVAVVTVASYRLVEEPIRRRRVLPRPRSAAVVVVGAVAAVASIVIVVPRPEPIVLAGFDAPDRVVDFGSFDDPVVPIVVDDRPRLLVVGGDETLAERIRRHVGDEFDVVDLSVSGCDVRLAGGYRRGCDSLDELLARASDVELTVVAVGENERRLVEAMIGPETPRGLVEFDSAIDRRFTVPLDYSRDMEAVLGDRPTLIVDAVRGDELGNRLADIGARRTSVAYVDRPGDEVWSSELDLLIAGLDDSDDRMRVVVIGDSVSFGVARVLNDLARDRYEIVWAGGRNCPVVEVHQIRWWEGLEFDMESCPTWDDTWTALLDDFRPDVTLLVVSVPEQSEQRYEPDGEWFLVDDAEFVRRHDIVMEAFVNVTESLGTRLVAFTSPPIHGGELGGAAFAEPERVTGWNRALVDYATRWPSIELFDWAEIVERYETADGGEPGRLRGDGVHMDEDVMAGILRAELIPFLDGSNVDDEASAPSD